MDSLNFSITWFPYSFNVPVSVNIQECFQINFNIIKINFNIIKINFNIIKINIQVNYCITWSMSCSILSFEAPLASTASFSIHSWVLTSTLVPTVLLHVSSSLILYQFSSSLFSFNNSVHPYSESNLIIQSFENST